MCKLLYIKILQLAMLIVTLCAATAEPLVIPMKQDPPIMVDGNADDWADVPSSVKLGKGSFLASFRGETKWSGEKDLSGVMRFCWKPNGIYLCAQVTDDVFMQKDSGIDCFYGDHLELFMDLKPEDAGNGNDFGDGQFQILVTPGDFANIKPQAILAFPEQFELAEAQCASTRQEGGWTVEAFIPWRPLKGGGIRKDAVIGMHAWICDSDIDNGDHPSQKQILTTGNVNAVFRKRADLAPAVFADAEGRHAIDVTGRQDVALDFSEPIAPGKSMSLTFSMPKHPPYLSPVLHLDANLYMDSPFAGYARVLDIAVNGVQLTGKELIKPRDEFFGTDGSMNTIYHRGIGYLVPYTNNGRNGNDPKYVSKYFIVPYKMHCFEIDLSGILKEGENKIQIRNSLQTKYTSRLELKNVRISAEPLEGRRGKEAPKGELARITPKPLSDISKVTVESSSNRISLTLPNGREFTVASKYSTPDGGWAGGSCRFFKHERTVEKSAECIVVKDTFTNLLDENLPIIQLHGIAEKDARYIVGGIESMASEKFNRLEGNTSVFAQTSSGSIGMYASSIVFREHFHAKVTKEGSVVMGDINLALPPKGSMTQEFLVVPLENGDYYDFVNVVRRKTGVNVTLQGPMGTWAQDKNWMSSSYDRINMLGLHYMLCDLNSIGINFLLSDKRDDVKDMMAKIKKVRPSILNYRYFHSQLESNPDVEYKSGRLLLKNGSHAKYYGGAPIYLSLEGTAYSRMMEFVLDDILENWNVDGIFWDEFHYSRYEFHYGEPWDNCSADIDLETHRIDTLKSSVFLLQRPWKTRMVDKIRAKGKRIYANCCTSMMGFEDKIDCAFVETQRKTNNVTMHFTTPLAHENCDGMKSMQDYYLKMMDSLDYGILGNYAVISVPEGPNSAWPTIAEYMYPTTPLELHAGYVIGKERIVTKESGTFGWNDDSGHIVHVFNAFGKEVKDHGMKTVTIDGKTFTELRLAGDWSAVIIRKR